MTSLMAKETREAPARVAALLARDEAPYATLAAELRARPPVFAATVARGSSDHAATYGASLLGLRAGLVTASLPPSLISRYGARLALDEALVLAISQSGASPDIVQTVRNATRCGARTVAIVNAVDSALAAAAGHVLTQHAGPEQSVAATKSFVCSLACIARLVALWQQDAGLLAALAELPARLEAALACDWSAALAALAPAGDLYVVGRGLGLGIAQECALKLKETSGLHAEALSAAELRHGPRAVIDEGFPVLALALADPAGDDVRDLARELEAAGACVALASAAAEPAPGLHLALPPPLHPLLDPIVAIQAFYPFAAALAEARGRDPDHPRGLAKVTRTL